MKSLWKDREAQAYRKDMLGLRVYTSRLLGANPDLVLHGGGNTSVKVVTKNFFNENKVVLFIKGSGWDLATIEKQGFAAVQMDTLLKLARLKKLSDSDMMAQQRAAMLDPHAPNPSIEAILHAIIPFRFVDHTHADSVVTVTNTPSGLERIKKIYGNRILIIPYVMPGFILARKIYEMTRKVNWRKLDGIILMNHGIFTFHDNAKESYELMIRLVTKAEKYIQKNAKRRTKPSSKPKIDLIALAKIRKAVSRARGKAVLVKVKATQEAVQFAGYPKISLIATRGVLTPDHVIRMKRVPVIIKKDAEKAVKDFGNDYQKYFNKFHTKSLTQLDPAPRWAVWLNNGILCFGRSIDEVNIISDIADHTMKSILNAEGLGGWRALPAKDVFDVEYWELEQAKLKAKSTQLLFQGKVALVTGAASGIGLACAEYFRKEGAAVIALDKDAKVKSFSNGKNCLGLTCDITKESSVKVAIESAVGEFGGLDILVNNAGIFPSNSRIEEMPQKTWEASLAINLTGHELVLKHCTPYLKFGIDPTVIFIASKNVLAPGPGASAYSVAKAGLTQLARVAALELGTFGIRVNIVHPNQVFDTAIWTSDVLQNRAKHYGMSVEEYKASNILRTAITSNDVAKLVGAMASDAFSKTTGSQVTIDGGNERTI